MIIVAFAVLMLVAIVVVVVAIMVVGVVSVVVVVGRACSRSCRARDCQQGEKRQDCHNEAAPGVEFLHVWDFLCLVCPWGGHGRCVR